MVAPLDAIATLLDEGAADSAVRMLRSSWEPDMPADARVPHYCMWIRGLCETGDLEHAVILARRASEEFPRDIDVLTALGNVCDLDGQLEQARDAFSVAIEVDPASALAHYNLGAVTERLGDDKVAERYYERALELESQPPLVEAVAALGGLLRRDARLAEALDVYDMYLAEDPLDVEILVEHGICLSDLEHFDEALDRFATALSLERSHAGAWYNQAITYYRLGRPDDARVSMEHAREAEPDNPLTLAVLGSWRLADPQVDLDDSLSLIYRALDSLQVLARQDLLSPAYAALVVEEAFEALWHAGRHREAREVAHLAGRRDWITPHMLEVLNQADYGLCDRTLTYRVLAKASAQETVPAEWPADAHGFTTDLTVMAEDEDEARALTLHWLSEVDPDLQIEVQAIKHEVRAIDARAPRPRGVARVETMRAFFR
jgi:tetratricopeptide (TPR) repeat protein